MLSPGLEGIPRNTIYKSMYNHQVYGKEWLALATAMAITPIRMPLSSISDGILGNTLGTGASLPMMGGQPPMEG
jgi:hypothetical protein